MQFIEQNNSVICGLFWCARNALLKKEIISNRSGFFTHARLNVRTIPINIMQVAVLDQFIIIVQFPQVVRLVEDTTSDK